MTPEQVARLAEVRACHNIMERQLIKSQLPRSSFPLHAHRAFLLALVDEQKEKIDLVESRLRLVETFLDGKIE
jgi:hypothetical protein